jgi:hypothetical protein
MTFIAVRCPHCQSDQIIKRGKTARGTQRYWVAIGRALQPFPRSKRSRHVSAHSAFQLGLSTLEGRIRRY